MCRKQAAVRGRVWLRLLIKDHPPSFCLFFSLLTSLKASWTSGQPRSRFFFCILIIGYAFGGIGASGLTDSTGGGQISLLSFLEVSWSLCGNHWLHGWGKRSYSQYKLTTDYDADCDKIEKAGHFFFANSRPVGMRQRTWDCFHIVDVVSCILFILCLCVRACLWTIAWF